MAWWVPGLNWGSGITRGRGGGLVEGLAQSVASPEGGTHRSGSFSSLSSAALGGEAEGPPYPCSGCRLLGRGEATQAVTGRLARQLSLWLLHASQPPPAASSGNKTKRAPAEGCFATKPLVSRRKLSREIGNTELGKGGREHTRAVSPAARYQDAVRILPRPRPPCPQAALRLGSSSQPPASPSRMGVAAPSAPAEPLPSSSSALASWSP